MQDVFDSRLWNVCVFESIRAIFVWGSVAILLPQHQTWCEDLCLFEHCLLLCISGHVPVFLWPCCFCCLPVGRTCRFPCDASLLLLSGLLQTAACHLCFCLCPWRVRSDGAGGVVRQMAFSGRRGRRTALVCTFIINQCDEEKEREMNRKKDRFE